MPWEPENFDLPAEPTDRDIRRAFRILLSGGAIGGDARWSVACVRALNELGPDSEGGAEAEEAYKRAAALAPPKRRPTGVGVLGRADLLVGRVSGDDVADDADAILKFRRQLEELGRSG